MKRFDIIDIAGIKEATVEKLIEVESAAKERMERMDAGIKLPNENASDYKWYRHVAYKCDYELKERGAREKEEWEALFD